MAIFALAGFGFLFRLITDPLALLNQLLFIAVITAIIFAIFKLVMQKRMGKSNSAFQRAAKQSKKRYGPSKGKFAAAQKIKATQKKQQKTMKPIRPLSSKRKRDNHLTLIEGKKGKKKNRAFF
jgi:Sec-independent protein translocase protein TatA